MNTKSSFAFALCLAAAFALPLQAQTPESGAAGQSGDAVTGAERPTFWGRFSATHDVSQDGVVSREEFLQENQRFERMDTDGDGQLTEADFEGMEGRRLKHRRGQRGGLIAGADLNRDGAVTAEEWASFESALDVDGDGLVSGEEMRALRDVRRGEKAARFGGRGGEKSGGGQLSRYDADQSGDLDAAERAAIFTTLDADGDGTVSADEMPRGRRGLERHSRRGGSGA
ncbi:MAG: hypothetical protein AAGF23_18515, partial [Acidobacteriota bacterium]